MFRQPELSGVSSMMLLDIGRAQLSSEFVSPSEPLLSRYYNFLVNRKYDKWFYKTLSCSETNSIEVRVLWCCAIVLIYMAGPGSYAVKLSAENLNYQSLFKVVAGGLQRGFGPKYFSVAFGLMFTQTVVFYGLLIIITQVDSLYDSIGDSGFFIAAGVAAATGIIIHWFVPEHLEILRENKKLNQS